MADQRRAPDRNLDEKLEQAIAAITNPLSRGGGPVPVELPAAAGPPADAATRRPPAPHSSPKPPKRPRPRTREEVFSRLRGPRVLENYPVAKRVYVDDEYTRMLDDLSLMFGQTHSELVRMAIALLHIEASEAAGAAGDAGRKDLVNSPAPDPTRRSGTAEA